MNNEHIAKNRMTYIFTALLAALCILLFMVVATSFAAVIANDVATTQEDTPISINVTANDVLSGTTTLTVTQVGMPISGTTSISGQSEVVYTPTANFYGTDTFTYSVTDGVITNMATVTIGVTYVNDAPIARDDVLTMIEDAGATVISVLGNDADVETIATSLTISSIAAPTNGTVTNIGSTVLYQPNANFNGQDVFTYTISDNDPISPALTATATVTVTVSPINDVPVANADIATTTQNSTFPIVISVLTNDHDSADTMAPTLAIDSVSMPSNGTVTLTVSGIQYLPDSGFYGVDTFTYVVSDSGGLTATATVSVTVQPTVWGVYLPILLKPVPPCEVASVEPNDTFDDAKVLAKGESCTFEVGGFNDIRDRYILDMTTTGNITVNLSDVASQADLDIFLYDENETEIARSNSGFFGDNEQIVVFNLPAGQYFLSVWLYAESAAGTTHTYKLIWQ